MTAQYHATIGMQIAIGTTAALASGDTYTTIEGAKMLGGMLGISYAQIDFTTLADALKQTGKGLGDAGTIEIGGLSKIEKTTGLLAPGQAQLETAANDNDDDNIYNFKITAKLGNGWYVKARVFSYQRTFGGNTNTEDFKATLIQQSLFTPFAAP